RPNDSIEASSAATQTTPGAMLRRVSLSGPIPRGKRLTTIMKKNTVARTSARRRQARIKSRHTSQPNIEGSEYALTWKVDFFRGPRILRVTQGRDARATLSNRPFGKFDSLGPSRR